MAQQLPANVKVLRLFGIEQAEVEKAMRNAGDQNAVQVRVLHQGGETLVLLQGNAEDPAACRAVFQRLTLRVKAACGVALYGENDTSLSHIAVAALKDLKKLFVCADEATGLLVNQRMEEAPGAEAVYDFGSESYAHARIGAKLEKAGKAGADPLKRAAARVKLAYKLSGADWAVSHVPIGNGEVWVLVGDKKGVWLRCIAATEKPALWILDILRRAALEQGQSEGTYWVRYGGKLPTVETQFEADDEEADSPQLVEPSAPQNWPVAQEKEEYEPEERLPPTGGARKALLAVLIVLLLAAAAAGILWWYSGGDFASLWNSTAPGSSGLTNADLL